MSAQSTPATRVGLTGPRALVGGRWRRAGELLGVARVTAPYSLAFVAGVVLAALTGMLVLVTALPMIPVTYGLSPWGRSWSSRVHHRMAWWWDARAAGLALNAERSLFGHDDGATDKNHLVVVPRLRRLTITLTGRCYTFKPLPGMTMADIAQAVPRLLLRWHAADVRVVHTLGERDVALVVTSRLPEVREWR